jgi:hypothetical protein
MAKPEKGREVLALVRSGIVAKIRVERQFFALKSSKILHSRINYINDMGVTPMLIKVKILDRI